MFSHVMPVLGLMVMSIIIGFALGFAYVSANLKETVTVTYTEGWVDEDGAFHEIIEEPTPPKLTLVKSSKEQ
jgi:hypothetical protein